ncbi:Protein fmp32, mitochondrial [Knufia obscura]|uniref:Protein fmp32, mitochondrial n=2 Tax=Knufia TaxID=430999 RepID=A0AAN8IHM7_9EURO|nr:Protein fmp32, mitochondrial [Knufia obscura]KAK5948202.1 Protein fmp32, mitochondrial [Knufia fluminis]
MAPHKAIIELPRFIYARVPAPASTFVKTTTRALCSSPPTARTRWHVKPTFQVANTPHQVSSIAPSRRRSSSNPSPPSSPRTRYTSSNPTSTDSSAPLRHDGTYATAFQVARRTFATTRANQKSHHFDTLKFVGRLKAEGFNETQAVAMMRVLNSVIEESIQNLTRTMVLKEDAERSTYTQKVDFAKLRSELANADSSEIQLTRSSHERLSSDLAKLSARLRDEIGRTQASVRLDLNLEKGRIREEANSQDMRIKETEARIEQEVAGLRERVEAVKFSTLQWLMGVCTGTAALILGAWRLLM